MQRLWLVRLGKNGEFETSALDNALLSIDFSMTADLSAAQNRDAILNSVKEIFPDAKPRSQTNIAAQINQFVNTIAIGDIVVSPLKTLGKIALGEVTGAYQQLANGYPARPVKWLATDISRDTFKQDLLFSFGAFMTVCEVSRNNALRRVLKVLETGRDPGDGVTPILPNQNTDEGVQVTDLDQVINLEQMARDQIERRISSIFTGHRFTELVAAILTAQGYLTYISPPGPDGGVDIVAGGGTIGFESPRLVVQVKSGNITVDGQILKDLIACVEDVRADQALMVSWSGFDRTVSKRTSELFFRVRFWGRDEIINTLLTVYDKLPEEIRAELPLRRTWILVPEDEEGALC